MGLLFSLNPRSEPVEGRSMCPTAAVAFGTSDRGGDQRDGGGQRAPDEAVLEAERVGLRFDHIAEIFIR